MQPQVPKCNGLEDRSCVQRHAQVQNVHMDTPKKTNIDSKNDGLETGWKMYFLSKSFKYGYFGVSMLNFRSVS